MKVATQAKTICPTATPDAMIQKETVRKAGKI